MDHGESTVRAPGILIVLAIARVAVKVSETGMMILSPKNPTP